MPIEDSYPSDGFDAWAEAYDSDVGNQKAFPFAGYQQVLETVVRLANARPGMSVLDLGTGTGNLALRFAGLGCELWCTDFSDPMLQRARQKLPNAHILKQDLRAAWPAGLPHIFDRIASAYVFHHFQLETKVELCKMLTSRHLQPGGNFIVADISFPDGPAMDAFANSVGELWEDEPYWLANEAVAALNQAGLEPQYLQVSACAGVYTFTA